MKNLLLLLGVTAAALTAQAQNQYLITFKDKGPEAAYYRQHPEKVLSERALARRQKHNALLKEEDLPVSNTYLKQLQEKDIEIRQKSKWLNAAYIETSLDRNDLQKQFPAIKTIKVYGSKTEKPAPAKFPEVRTNQSNTRLSYGASAAQIDQLNLDCMHDKGYQGKGILITVIDTGFPGVNTNAAYDSLRLQNRILATRNFVSKPTTVYGSYSHGTFVFSTMAANKPGVYVGAAAQATYALALTENMASETHQEELNWAAAAEWADSLGADIIQSSLGYKFFDAGQGDYADTDLDGDTPIITRAADKAAQKGMLVVSSAGNEGASKPPRSNRINPPCDGDSVLCVGSVTSANQYSSFSSVGPTADNRIKPDVVARGTFTHHLSVAGGPAASDGTSVAAPLISSVAAALIQANPGATNMQVLNAIKQSADKFSNPNNQFGWGLPDACKADSLLRNIMHVQKEKAARPVKVYPTVFKEQLTLEVPAGLHLLQAELFTVTGQRVFFSYLEKADKMILHPGQNLPKGLYLLRLQDTAGKMLQYKVIKE
ncbi:S8 family peptidase [Adhaeribacter soli]|uniref:S8 family serine peptidase n=1 Tax=Adhaeribacter soli TaxID=2607655 RepID=A0A5N1J161_9BACT|nr:S8 family peptidase [Adhaeribacter soli]KAA9340241.1 S8 family serine peptidase [Adhaeribacter soli]